MSTKRPTKTDADHLVESRKIISANVKWRPAGTGWRIQARVLAVDIKETFEIRGVIGRTNHSFVLLYHNYPIRKYTAHTPHKIGAKIFSEPHKHVWDGESDGMLAYIPKDIDPKADINDQFLAFCNECNIELLGEYQFVSSKL